MKTSRPAEQKTVWSLDPEGFLQRSSRINTPGKFAEVRAVFVTAHSFPKPSGLCSPFNFCHPVVFDRQSNRLAQIAGKALKKLKYKSAFDLFGANCYGAAREKFPRPRGAVDLGLLIDTGPR